MATLLTLVTNMQAALTTGGSPLFSASNCFYAFDPKANLKVPPTDQFCVIQPNGLSVVERAWNGGNGAINYVTTWKATIWLFVRSATDLAHQENLYLLNEATGSLALADQVIDLFQGYKVADGGNFYGYELDEVVFQSEDRDSKGWAVTKLRYHSDFTGR